MKKNGKSFERLEVDRMRSVLIFLGQEAEWVMVNGNVSQPFTKLLKASAKVGEVMLGFSPIMLLRGVRYTRRSKV